MAKDEISNASMVAPQPPKGGRLQPIGDLAVVKGVSATALAGIMRAKRWAAGKQVTEEEFSSAVAAFDNRVMGGGRI